MLAKSDHGPLYHQTLRFFKGMVVVLTARDIETAHHLNWLEALNDLRNEVKGDWIRIFARALAIY
jgi:hypothetical protein